MTLKDIIVLLDRKALKVNRCVLFTLKYQHAIVAKMFLIISESEVMEIWCSGFWNLQFLYYIRRKIY